MSHTLGSTNPYLTQLEAALAHEDVRTRPFSSRALLHREIDVWQMHWPDAVSRRERARQAYITTARLLRDLVVARLRGVAVVWTVHNVEGHDTRRPTLERLVRVALSWGVHGWIALSEESVRPAQEAMPRLRRRPWRVIPHGHYRDVYPPIVGDRAAAREALDLPHDAEVLLFLGLVRPYKNVPGLIRAFAQLPGAHRRLVIAGRLLDEDEDLLRRLAAADPRVRLHLDHVDEDVLPAMFSASDLAVLPFRAITNSGSAILALSFDTPVVVPRLGAMPSLRRQAGDAWVHLYDGELTAQVLSTSLHAAAVAQGGPDLRALSWDHIGARTAEFYRSLVTARSQRRRSATTTGTSSRRSGRKS